jgi:hypothetical protein
MSFQHTGQAETLVTDAIVQLFSNLAPAYHPSSNNSDFHKLANALKALCVNVLERQCARASVAADRHRRASVARVAKATVALALRLTYSRDLRVRQAGQQVVQSLSRVAPALTSEALVRRMDEALNSVTSAHQAPSVLRSFAYAMKSILLVPSIASTGTTTYSLFPRLVDLLRLSLPGLDANDTMKTIATVSCFVQLFSWLHVGRDEHRPSLPDAATDTLHPDAEATLARLNIGLEEFIPLLVDRIMALIRSMDGRAGANAAGLAAQMEHARDIALTSLCEALVAGMSPDLRAATLKQLLPDILKNPCRGTGGKAGRLRL